MEKVAEKERARSKREAGREAKERSTVFDVRKGDLKGEGEDEERM